MRVGSERSREKVLSFSIVLVQNRQVRQATKGGSVVRVDSQFLFIENTGLLAACGAARILCQQDVSQRAIQSRSLRINAQRCLELFPGGFIALFIQEKKPEQRVRAPGIRGGANQLRNQPSPFSKVQQNRSIEDLGIVRE